MDPVVLETHQFTYRGSGEVGNLTGEKNSDGSFTSHWEPSEAELAEWADAIKSGNFMVELTIFGAPIPPVSLRMVGK